LEYIKKRVTKLSTLHIIIDKIINVKMKFLNFFILSNKIKIIILVFITLLILYLVAFQIYFIVRPDENAKIIAENRRLEAKVNEYENKISEIELELTNSKIVKEEYNINIEPGSELIAVDDGVAYFVKPMKEIYALSLNETSQKLFSVELKQSSVTNKFSIIENTLYVDSQNQKDGNYLYAIDKKTGKNEWKFLLGDKDLINPPVLSGSSLLVGTNTGGHYYSLNKDTGVLNWRFTVEPIDQTDSSGTHYMSTGALNNPYVNNGLVYFGSSLGNVYGLDFNTGAKIWEYSIELADKYDGIWNAPYISDGTIYLAHKNIVAVALKSKGTIWKYRLDDSIKYDILNYQDSIIQTCWDSQIISINMNSGKENWRIKLDDNAVNKPLIKGGYIYAFSEKGHYYKINSATGEVKLNLQISDLDSKQDYKRGLVADTDHYYYINDDFRLVKLSLK
jgi:outer membrane protein assembly factor BamB